MRRASSLTLGVAITLLAGACAGLTPPPAAPDPDPVPVPDAAPIPAPEPPPEPEDRAEPGRNALGSVAYSLPVVDHYTVVKELDFLVGERHNVISTWVRRGEPYRPFIERTLADHGLPTDLYHLAMIESGFMPTARSHAGAVGMWQFMPATGRSEGLRIDGVVDERMDPVRSTRAAARHLVRLYSAFGDWPLAAAAYNAGAGRVTRSMRRFGADNFWDLSRVGDLAAETRQYVPRLYAVTIVGRDPVRFGIPRSAEVLPFAFDSVHVDVETPLTELARIAELPLDPLRRLNPHLVHGVVPADYHVWVPVGSAEPAQARFLASDFRRRGGYEEYVVRPGDSLWRLADRSGVSAAEIRRSNEGIDFERLRTGQRIRLAPAALARLEEVAGAAMASRQDVTPPSVPAEPAADAAPAQVHEVAPGETLWEIGRRHGVSVEALRAANGLPHETIRPGDRLRLPESALGTPAAEATAMTAEGAGYVEHEVAPGETLWGIARQYEVPVDAIRERNSLPDDRIVPGQRLRIDR